MKKYGGMLMEKHPDESTALLTALCTGYRPMASSFHAGMDEGKGERLDPSERAEAEEFLHVFTHHPAHLKQFLLDIEKVNLLEAHFGLFFPSLFFFFTHPPLLPLLSSLLADLLTGSSPRSELDFTIHVQSSRDMSPRLLGALLQVYLQEWDLAKEKGDHAEAAAAKTAAVDLLHNKWTLMDKDQALILCQNAAFKPGVVFLYEKSEL